MKGEDVTFDGSSLLFSYRRIVTDLFSGFLTIASLLAAVNYGTGFITSTEWSDLPEVSIPVLLAFLLLAAPTGIVLTAISFVLVTPFIMLLTNTLSWICRHSSLACALLAPSAYRQFQFHKNLNLLDDEWGGLGQVVSGLSSSLDLEKIALSHGHLEAVVILLRNLILLLIAVAVSLSSLGFAFRTVDWLCLTASVFLLATSAASVIIYWESAILFHSAIDASSAPDIAVNNQPNEAVEQQ